MFKLYLDPGHGGNDTGASGHGLLEKEINLDIALRIRDILNNEYQQVEVNMSRTTDTSVSLRQRTNQANAWDADYFLSIHCNAFNGSTRGYEDFIYSGLSNSSSTAQYQNVLHEAIIAVNELTDRGQKKANFHVLRESTMPALLTENGFIDHSGDAAKLADASYRQKVARGHVNGLERAFNLEKSASGTRLYKVIAGSFLERANAEKRVAYLDTHGISSFITEVSISGNTRYRVQAGAYESKSNAENRVAEVKRAGITDAYIIEEGQGDSEVSGYNISGSVILSPEQMDQFVQKINPDAPSLGIYYLNFGTYYGLRGDVAFAQALHETDYFRFTGIVNESQNNFAGIGATGPGQPGANFATAEDGVLAHMQHLYAYASTQALPDNYRLVDPRFDLVQRGSATKWEALNGKWAVPGDQYGQLILGLYQDIINASIDQLEDILAQIKG
ncbi:N-acetylmuramoyl-L-alanine amidase [Halobacillus seohaensis]|uniref:N-acetylmuramoyl-L-alanine amidase n=1 Tax=Halobacillus seohaensis TaxID=447421 RepID=A0ABW2EJ37_9BACI